MPQAAVPQSARASAALAGQPTPLGVPRASWAPSAEPPQTLHLIPRLVKSLGILNGQSSEVGDGHVLCALAPGAAGDGHRRRLAALGRLDLQFAPIGLYLNNLAIGLALVAAVLRQRVVELRRRDAHLQRLHSYCPAIAVSYTHLRAHETGRNLVCRLLLEK